MSRFHRIGWWLFLASAVAFTVSGLRTREPWVVAGAITFGVACVLFLVDRE